MKNYVCQICLSNKTIKNDNILFCESCNVYYTIYNNIQKIRQLPIKDTSQISFEFCTKCKERFKKKESKIRCRNFKEYLSKLPACNKCKIKNKDFISNLYYNNFSLYRKEVHAFNFLSKILFFIFFLIFPFFYVVIGIEYLLNSLSMLKFIMLILMERFFGNYDFVKDFFFIYIFLKKIIAKKIVFDLPSDLQRDDNLHHFIQRLKITEPFNSSDIVSKIDTSHTNK